MTRRAWFFGTYFVVLAVGVSAAMHIAPRLLWNSTASVPVGLYRLRTDGSLHVGDLAAPPCVCPTGWPCCCPNATICRSVCPC